MSRICATAQRLAEMAAAHPATAQVYYPGLAASAGHDIARRLTGGRFGGVLSFALRDPSQKAAVYNAFGLFLRATSLGEVASLVDSFRAVDVLRLSTGIEDAEDLATDLQQALDAAAG